MIVSLFFIASAVAKGMGLKAFELYVYSLGLASYDCSSLVARIVIILELGTGLWLLSGWKTRLAKCVAAAEIIGFSCFLLWRLAIGDARPCHCLGELVNLSPAPSLAKNLGLLLLIGLYVPMPWKIPGWLPGGLTILSAGLVFVLSPPDVYFRLRGDQRTDIVQQQWDAFFAGEPRSGKKLVCFLSTRCPYCRGCAHKNSEMILQNDISVTNVQLYFLDVSDSTALEIATFFREEMQGRHYPFQILPPDRMLPITGGTFPTLAISDNGHLVREFDCIHLDEKYLREQLSPEE